MSFTFDFDAIRAAKPSANAANQLKKESPTGASISATAVLAAPHESFRQGQWGEHQIAVFHARRKRCIALGFGDGELFAEILALRDADRDDRTLCVECSHCRRSGCAKGDAWLPRLLQRCDRFKAAALQVEEDA